MNKWASSILAYILSSLFLGLALLGMSSHVWAAGYGVSVSSGYGAANIVPLRVGFQKNFDKRWCPEAKWPVSGYWEGSLYAMKGERGESPDSNRRLNAVALAGVFRFERAKESMVGWPYIELGVGFSWLSRREIGGRNLGMRFQFEDRFGVGICFGKNGEYDLGYKAVHFSNAYMGSDNHGINLHLITLGYWFR
jgi:lipid A 3-O-deacylase